MVARGEARSAAKCETPRISATTIEEPCKGERSVASDALTGLGTIYPMIQGLRTSLRCVLQPWLPSYHRYRG